MRAISAARTLVGGACGSQQRALQGSRAAFETHRAKWLANVDLPQDLARLDEEGQLKWVHVRGKLTHAHVGGSTPIAAAGLHESGVLSWIARAKHGLIGYTTIGRGCYIASCGGEHEEFDFEVGTDVPCFVQQALARRMLSC